MIKGLLPKTPNGVLMSISLCLKEQNDLKDFAYSSFVPFNEVASAIADLLAKATEVDFSSQFLIFLGSNEYPSEVSTILLGEVQSTDKGDPNSFSLYGTSDFSNSIGVIYKKIRRVTKEDSNSTLSTKGVLNLHIVKGVDTVIYPIVDIQPLSNVLASELASINEYKQHLNTTFGFSEGEANLPSVDMLFEGQTASPYTESALRMLPSGLETILRRALIDKEFYKEQDLESHLGSILKALRLSEAYSIKLEMFSADGVTVDYVRMVDSSGGYIFDTIPSASTYNYTNPLYVMEFSAKNLATSWWADKPQVTKLLRAIIFDVEKGKVALARVSGSNWKLPNIKMTVGKDLTAPGLNKVIFINDSSVEAYLKVSSEDAELKNSIASICTEEVSWFPLESFPDKENLVCDSYDTMYTEGWGVKLSSDRVRFFQGVSDD